MIISYHIISYQCCIDVHSDSQYLCDIRREQLERELAAGEAVPFRVKEVPTTSSEVSVSRHWDLYILT